MPREQINYPSPKREVTFTVVDLKADPETGAVTVAEREGSEQFADGTPVGDGCVSRKAPTLHVGWHKDAWAQLSIEGDISYFRFAAEHPDAEDGRSSVYTEPLSRDELNKLIRSLRRARDQVFGGDQ